MQETQVQPWGWKDPRRRKWQLASVCLPGKSHGQRSLAGYSPLGHKRPNGNWDFYNYTCSPPSLPLSLVRRDVGRDLQGGLSVSVSPVKILQSNPAGLQSQIL